MVNSISSHRQTVETLAHSYSFNRPQDMLRQRSQSVDELSRRLEQSVTHYFQHTKSNLQSLSTRVGSLNPRLVLKRGYSIVKQNGKAISSIRQLEEKKEAAIEFYDGRSIVKVEQKIVSGDVKKRK